jgi:hypothetical protein
MADQTDCFITIGACAVTGAAAPRMRLIDAMPRWQGSVS